MALLLLAYEGEPGLAEGIQWMLDGQLKAIEVQAIEVGVAAIITEASGCVSGYADFWVQSLGVLSPPVRVASCGAEEDGADDSDAEN